MPYKYLSHINIKSILSSALSLSLLFPLWATAIDPTTSGRILDNFKKEETSMLFDTLPFDQEDSTKILEHEYAMGGLSALKDRLAQVQKTYETKKSFVTEKRVSLEEAIATLDAAIASTEADIQKTQDSIAERNGKINVYNELSTTLKAKIDKNKAIILAYLANIYSEGNQIFDANNNVDIFQSLLLSDGSTDAIATDITYKSLVSILGQSFIVEYRGLVRDYTRNALALSEEVDSLQQDQDLLERQRTNLDTQKAGRVTLLEITKGQEALFEKYIDSQKKAQEAVEKSWQEASASYEASLDTILEKNGCSNSLKKKADDSQCDDILAYYRNEHALKNTDSGTGTNIFTWPVKPKGISTYFHDDEYYAALHSQHEAIDIRVAQGTDILAPADGYVTYILPPVPGGYSYMALKHADGYVSVYGHLSEIFVSSYQFVHKGDRIARSGGAVGTPGAGPMTSGPHLHLEIWKDKNPIDPLRVLDTTVLNYADLPTKYQAKYVADVVEKSGNAADGYKFAQKFVLKGEDEVARQKYLLSIYAAPDFKNWDMWTQVALEARIDPSFLMCVGLAETTLGNHLKTAYNIGNVGNTDDGSTTTFSSPKEGLRWMVATFNNKYLGGYDTVDQLSRWGNDSGPIYASSNSNWHNNNIKCLSALKGRWVEDNYRFRVK